MFFKPKLYKSEGETAAIILAGEIKNLAVLPFLESAEAYTKDALSSCGVLKASNSQYKQIAQLAVKFHELDVSYSNNKEKIPGLRDQILIDFL
ncbi:hypothetical protein OAK06_07970 [Gammaproteobacteria bacterium]|nr:hypothetical protein [Gammaproteobacteria bacterium]